MSKRKETLEIENKLHYMCQQRRIYGCEEVTIGFYSNGHGNEIVDFCTMDSKGILRCYEIKVTLSDLKSKAKKSWYGHYNYLFVTKDLYNKIYDNLDTYIPKYVGVAVPCSELWSEGVEIVRNAKKQDLTIEQETMLKESMVRSMSYKLQKYREATDLSAISKLKSELRAADKDAKQYSEDAHRLRFTISRLERALRLYYGRDDIDLGLEELAENITNRKIFLPEKIELTLTENGSKYNQQVKLFQEEALYYEEN